MCSERKVRNHLLGQSPTWRLHGRVDCFRLADDPASAVSRRPFLDQRLESDAPMNSFTRRTQ